MIYFYYVSLEFGAFEKIKFYFAEKRQGEGNNG